MISIGEDNGTGIPDHIRQVSLSGVNCGVVVLSSFESESIQHLSEIAVSLLKQVKEMD